MKKYALVLATLLMLTDSFAQDRQQDIDTQVWKPFTEAIMTQNVQRFISLHSNDVVRIERDSKKILKYDQYRSEMAQSWPGWKESIAKNNIKYVFELRFTERFSTEDTAYESGYFKNETTDPSGNVRKSYGRFHVVLRRESGADGKVWKILLDSDTNEGGTITDEMFLAASPLK